MFFIVSVSSLTRLNHFQRRNRQTEGERLATQAKDQARRAEVALLSLFLYLPCTHTTKKMFSGTRSRDGGSQACSPCWPDGPPSSGPSFIVCFFADADLAKKRDKG